MCTGNKDDNLIEKRVGWLCCLCYSAPNIHVWIPGSILGRNILIWFFLIMDN